MFHRRGLENFVTRSCSSHLGMGQKWDITYKSQHNVTAISHCDITGISHTSHNMMSLQDRIVTSLWYRIPVTLWRELKRHRCDITYMSPQEQISTSVGYPHCDWDLDDITAISHTSYNMMSLQDRIVISLYCDGDLRDITVMSHTSHIITVT